MDVEAAIRKALEQIQGVKEMLLQKRAEKQAEIDAIDGQIQTLGGLKTSNKPGHPRTRKTQEELWELEKEHYDGTFEQWRAEKKAENARKKAAKS